MAAGSLILLFLGPSLSFTSARRFIGMLALTKAYALIIAIALSAALFAWLRALETSATWRRSAATSRGYVSTSYFGTPGRYWARGSSASSAPGTPRSPGGRGNELY